jgi:hypothetical protein
MGREAHDIRFAETLRTVLAACVTQSVPKGRLKNPDLRALIPGAGVNWQLDVSEAVPSDTLNCS